MCKQKKSDGASLRDEMACPDSLRTKKPAQRGRTEATRIIHHLQWEHPLSPDGMTYLVVISIDVHCPNPASIFHQR